MIGDKGNRNKNTGTIDVNMLDVSDEFLKKVSIWTSFYKCFPFRFAEDFIGVKLEPFQKILLYTMFHNQYFQFVASRGLGKTWLLAVFIICRAVLYPKSKIVLSAGQKSMSLEVINYIKAFYDESECVRRSITYLSDSINDPKVDFAGGSTVRIALARDTARGKRANVLILDEHRTIPKDILDTVLRQFASDRRRPKFYELPEWKDYPMEENQELYCSSAWFCYHWSYEKFLDYLDQMVKGKSYFLVDLPYQISVKAGLKSITQIHNQMTENTFNPISWKMEMEGRWIGQDSSAFFRHEVLDACRKIKKPLYPREMADFLESKNKKYLDTRKRVEDGEIRLLFADVAMASGNENDATILGVMRLIPNRVVVNDVEIPFYIREVSYMKSIRGGRVDDQAIEIRRMFDEFECDYIVLDGQGLGQALYDELSKPITDKERGVEYVIPFSCINYEKWEERCTYPNAQKVIYAIHATAELNSNIAYAMLDAVTKKRIRFLINENDAKEIVSSIKDYHKMSAEIQMKILDQYYQSSALINEMINLKKIESPDTGRVKLVEPSGALKDRYSAVSYANYIADELQQKLLKPIDEGFANWGALMNWN